MSPLFEQLGGLAAGYHQRLSDGEVNRRFAHHLCHVAPELWLAQELAFLVNDEGTAVGLAGWNALIEVRRVDVTLVRPVAANDAHPIYLELKLVPPDYWSNWHEVYHDLACHPEKPAKSGKPPAHFAVCFLVDVVSQGAVRRRPEAKERFRQYVARVPSEPGPFQPIEGLPPLWLEQSSPPIRACWLQPVHGSWPFGYESTCRILWVSSGP
jgi:hypothetical protein